MKSVMFCSELDGGRSRIAKALLLAEKLLDAGCEITFAFRDLAKVDAGLPTMDYRLVQSPVCVREPADTDEPASYAELLLRSGFASPTKLAGLTRAWRGLYDAFKVDLVIADYAPNALLAARTRRVPVALYGNGFFVPPPVAPMPPYRTWESCPTKRITSAESLALQSANHCLQCFGAPEMTHLHELLSVRENFLCTVPELDFYKDRQSGRHCGPVYVDQVGETPAWPAISEAPAAKKIFASMNAQMPGLDALLRSLAASGAAVLVCCAGVDSAWQDKLEGGAMHFLRRPVNLRAVMAQADIAVCGGTDTAYCALFNGVPLLGTPLTAEQRIATDRIAHTGAGLWALPGSNTAAWSAKLSELLNSPTYRQHAAAFARRYAKLAPGRNVEAIAERCIEMLG